MIWKMYIGPLPLNPVTASSWYSGSSTTVPIDSTTAQSAQALCAVSAGATGRGSSLR